MSSAQSLSARSPLWPNGGCPMSWLRHAVSTTSGDSSSAIASSRPTCATSSECVSRLRAKSAGLAGLSTCVFAARRRSRRVQHAGPVTGEAVALRAVRLGMKRSASWSS
jgi:hypothetical protein